MSKKSRRRNKKLLMLAALAGGAALAGRGKGVAQGVSGADKAAFTSDAAYSPSVTKPPRKDVLPVIKPVIKPKRDVDFGMAYQSSRGAGEYPGSKVAPATVNGVTIKGRANANDPRSIPFNPAQGNVRPTMERILRGNTRGWKKGGRVTGIAKRGFGRALEKGKK